MEIHRNTGYKALSTVLENENNIKIIEKNVYLKSLETEDNIKYYNIYLYQVIGDIINNCKLSDVLSNIKTNKLLWEHDSFSDIRKKIEEQDDFIVNPFEVEEGVLQCKCGSKRVFSYSKQVRSGDESSTTFAQCVVCKSKWVYSG